MDNNPYNAPPEARFTMPSQLPERGNNTYNIPPTITQPEQKSVFEQYPFHSYLVDHAKQNDKNPYDYSDKEIHGALDKYLDTVLGNQLTNEKGFANAEHFRAALDKRKEYYGPLARARLEQDMPNLKTYLNGLRPTPTKEDSQTPPRGTSDIGEALATGAQRSALSTLRGLGMAGAGLAKVASETPTVSLAAILARKLGAKVPTAEDVQNALFTGMDAAKKTEEALPQATTTGGKIAEFVGALPGAILSAGTGAPGAIGQDILDRGGSLASAEGNAAISAALNAAGIKGASLGATPLARAALGGATGGGLSAAEQLATTGKVDPLTTALATGAGAAGGVLTRGEVRGKAESQEVPPIGEGQGAGGTDIAGKPVSEGRSPIAPDNVALNAKTKAKLGEISDEIGNAETPEAAKQLWEKHASGIDEAQRPAAQRAFAQDWAEVHDRSPEELNATPSAEEQALASAATESLQESLQTPTKVDENQQATPSELLQVEPKVGRPNPLAKAKPIDASMFTREHLADAERYHAEQDITKKGSIKKKIIQEAGIPKKDVEAFLDAMKPRNTEATGSHLAPKVKRR